MEFSDIPKYTSPVHDDSRSSGCCSIPRDSPNFNLLGNVGATPFHRYSRTRRDMKGLMGPNPPEEDIYAPDLMELDELDNILMLNWECFE
jgi:hypothetical protein